ncbi:serine/threonine-protein kinase PKN1 [Plesiocystis pacifica SIR-1]|uniref:Serine/threonine-protein kinase PKN1 n=2 Tax=Plesiocystis pacifica TaxID=191768 RepID=A6GA47_9BACT|nr:serine/threonine-protein kinase PKN1 [Plesiocystis pacifica SIR-1]
MGDVYVAEQKGTGRKVAMKILKEELSTDPSVVERFLREAQATGQLTHPNIVEILDVGRSRSGTVFFVMELLRGRELGELLAKVGRLSWYRARHILTQIAEGLAEAHRHGVVHRDMKPDNVYLVRRGEDRDHVKILDFGIAKIEGAAALTQAGMVFGTAGYMAPEQVLAGTIDGRTDVYALACMAFEMLTGRLPFDESSPMRMLNMHVRQPAPSPLQLIRQSDPTADFPEALDAALLRALAKKPDERFPDMASFGRALGAIPAREPQGDEEDDIENRTTLVPGQSTSQGAAKRGKTQIHTGPPPAVSPTSASASSSGASASASTSTRRTLIHTAPPIPGAPPPTTGSHAPKRKAQATMLMDKPPVIPSADRAVEPAAPQAHAEKRRRPQATALMEKPPIIPPAPGQEGANEIHLPSLGFLFLGLANTLAGTASALPMDTLVRHLRTWAPDLDGPAVRSLATQAWSKLMVLPTAEARRERVLEEVYHLAVMPPDRAVDLVNELYEIAGRQSPVNAKALSFIVDVSERIGLGLDPRMVAVAYMHICIAHSGERLDTRELTGLRELLHRWGPNLESPKVDLIVRWAVAEFEQRATMHERWLHAYQIASDFGSAYTVPERKAVMADLRAIAEADGFIDAREKRLLAELGQRLKVK